MLHRIEPRLFQVVLLLGCAALALSRPAPARGQSPPPDPAQVASAPVAPGQTTSGTLFVPSRTVEGGVTTAPLLDSVVELRVTGIILRATVRQRFANPSDDWIEGLYVFPLPEMAAVDALELRVGDRVVEGRIQERGEARRTYAKARDAGHKASLVEQERPNVFTTSVANIGPGEQVVVSIAYQEVLRFDDGGFALRFPMLVAPRYTPESGTEAAPHASLSARELPTPEAPRVAPEAAPLHRVALSVSLDAGFPIAQLESPSHSFAVDAPSAGQRTIRVNARADRDFVLRWKPSVGSRPTAALFSEATDDGGDVPVLLMVLPPGDGFEPRSIPREVVIVIDTSGSMGGASIRQARSALLLALERLGPDDWFNVIAFAEEAHSLFPASVPADARALDAARDFVRTLDADGGTEMLPALAQALTEHAGASGSAAAGLRQVVFITDGSVGNETELFSLVRSRLGRSRLFAVGIGSAPNGYFLQRVARFGRGTFTYVASSGEVTERMTELFEKLERPALSDVEVHWNDPVEMWPERVPDLYAGEPLVVTARVPRFVGDVVLSGAIGNRPWEVRLSLAPGSEEAGIGKLWARSKIAALMDGISEGADREAVREEVVAVALEHHIVSRFTSLVAVDVTPSRPAHAEPRAAAVPLNLPHGWEPGSGSLPRGGTPALLQLIGGAGLLASAAAVRAGRWRRSVPR